ncbi:hypothetical protein C4K41_26820 [Escherichia coli]|nr:hypothetical protein C4K41_26820 [Escherichia coli]
MLPSETMIWQPEFTDKTLSRKPGAVHSVGVNRVYPISRCRGTREPPSLMWLKDRHNLYYRNPLFKVIYGRRI